MHNSTIYDRDMRWRRLYLIYGWVAVAVAVNVAALNTIGVLYVDGFTVDVFTVAGFVFLATTAAMCLHRAWSLRRMWPRARSLKP